MRELHLQPDNPMRFFLVLIFALLLVLLACTENERAKSFGGTMNLALPCGQKLTDVTWKDSTLWYAYRPMRPGELPETTTFRADTSFALLEGQVVVKECP